jgi:hypothetical protein
LRHLAFCKKCTENKNEQGGKKQIFLHWFSVYLWCKNRKVV